MTATRLPTGFGSLDQPASWPPPRARPRPELLAAQLDTLPGVGVTIRRRLQKLGLETVGDLLSHRPFRYEQPVRHRRIADLFGDEEVAIEGTVSSASLRRPRRGLTILEAVVSDGTGTIKASWFNQGWLAERLQPGTHVRLRGQTTRYGFDGQEL